MRRIVLFAFPLALAAAAPAQILQLKDGQILVGKVEDPSEQGLTFRRLDNGGVLSLRWEQLSRESAGKIKALNGLSTEDEGEVLVPAVAVEFELPGGGRDTVVGRIIDENDSTITARRQGVSYPIPRARIKARPDVEVPATDVYTQDEFYHEKLQEIDPGDDADKHVELAEILERVRDYDHAEEHLLRAKELGNSKQPNLIEGRLQRLARFKESAAERDLLDAISVAMARHHFERGLEAIAEYDKRYENGKLRPDFERLKKRFDDARERYLVDRMADLWGDTVWALARTKANEQVSYDAAKDYALEGMGKDVRQRVGKALHLDPDEVDAMWQKRLDYPGLVRPDGYYYGVGSWTLGEQDILAGTKQGEVASESTGDKDREMQRALERIRRAQERARKAMAKQGGPQAAEEATPESWWESATSDERRQWLRAYYAEHSGDLQVEDAHVTECKGCGGLGQIPTVTSSGEAQNVDCPTCHGTRFKRWFRAR